MRAPTPEQLEAIQRLASRPEGRIVHEYLQQAQAEARERLERTDEPQHVRALQGEARAITFLLQRWSTTPINLQASARP